MISDNKTVTYLAPDFQTFTTYDSASIIAACEFTNVFENNTHFVAFISPRMIEVFKCVSHKYNYMRRCRVIDFISVSI